jgi:hypothetical protein
MATLAGYYFIVPGHYKIVPSRQHEFVALLGRKILHWGCLGPKGGVLGTCYGMSFSLFRLGNFCQMATRATGHLGFGVFIAR